MLDVLKFVQGAVAKKDYVPELMHFSIVEGRITGYNGVLSISAPIALNLNANPKAVPFIKAIQTCRDVVAMHLTPTGRLSIKSGAFKALVECIDQSFTGIIPEGKRFDTPEGFLKTLKVLEPFIAEDASRPWARGILFSGASAFTTNNIVLVQKWLAKDIPQPFNLPHSAVNELIRIGEDPEFIQVSDTSASFHYSGKRWIRTQLYSTDWPDINRILDRESSQAPFHASFFAGLEDLKPFVEKDERVYLTEKGFSTSKADEQGASFDILGLPEGPVFNLHHLLSLDGIADTIDLTAYPKPCIFYNRELMLRGAIAGMRV